MIRSTCTPNIINGKQQGNPQNLLTSRGKEGTEETAEGGVLCLFVEVSKRAPGFLQLPWERRQRGWQWRGRPAPCRRCYRESSSAGSLARPLQQGQNSAVPGEWSRGPNGVPLPAPPGPRGLAGRGRPAGCKGTRWRRERAGAGPRPEQRELARTRGIGGRPALT